MNIVKIPIELLPEFQRDSIRAWRDLGAQPSEAIEAYYPDGQIVERNANVLRKNPWDDERHVFVPEFVSDNDIPRVIHIDPSLKCDRTGFAMGCQRGTRLMGQEIKPFVHIDCMFGIKAQPGTEIMFENIRELIYILKQRGFNIYKVTYDTFQSADSIQILQGRGIMAEILSCDRTLAPHEMLKSAIVEKRIDYPHYPLFEEEIQGLELIKGKKVDHRPKGSKDVADAVAGVVYEICKTPIVSDTIISSGGESIIDDPNFKENW